MGGARNAQHAQAGGGHRVDGLRQRRAVGRAQPAKTCDRFGGALGGDEVFLPVAIRLPDVGYGEEIGPKTIGVHQLPVRMPIRGLGQPLARQGMERPLHRVERLGRAGEQAELAQVVELRRHFRAVLRAEDVPIRQPQLDDRHPVFGEGAGLVGAQHGGRAQRLDRRRAPRQDARQRNSPRAHRHEDGQDHRKLFRQHRHAQRNSGQHRIQPSAAHDAVEQHREHADPAAENGKQPDDAPCLHLQARRFGFEGGQRLADLADLALRTDGGYFRQPRAAHHQRTGEDMRQVVASRTLRSRAWGDRPRRPCAPARIRRSGSIRRPADPGNAGERHRQAPGRLRKER